MEIDSDNGIPYEALEDALYSLNKSLSVKGIYIRKQGIIDEEFIHEYDERDIMRINSNMIEALDDIENLFKKRKSINTNMSSYSLKALFEDYRQSINRKPTYISNGEFIVCMICYGYNYKLIYHTDDLLSKNVYFNVSTPQYEI